MTQTSLEDGRGQRRSYLPPAAAPQPAAPGPPPPQTASPAAPPASPGARRSPGCGGRTPASTPSGSSERVPAAGRGRTNVDVV